MNPELDKTVARMRRTADVVVTHVRPLDINMEHVAIDLRQGANTIEDLQKQVESYEEVLAPFARFADVLEDRIALAGPSPLFAVREECEAARKVLREYAKT